MAASEFTVGPLATELFSKGLIHAAQHGVAMNANQPALDRATCLARSVLVRIENRASVFNQHMSVLENCDMGNIASYLEFDMAKRKNQGYCLHVDIDHKLWNNYNPNQLGQILV